MTTGLCKAPTLAAARNASPNPWRMMRVEVFMPMLLAPESVDIKVETFPVICLA